MHAKPSFSLYKAGFVLLINHQSTTFIQQLTNSVVNYSYSFAGCFVAGNGTSGGGGSDGTSTTAGGGSACDRARVARRVPGAPVAGGDADRRDVAHRLPLPAAQALDQRSEWANVLQGALPPLLPVQPQGRGVGQHRVGALGLNGPDRLDGAGPGDLPVQAVRHQGLLVGLRHPASQRRAGGDVHRHRPRRAPGAERGLPQEPLRPVPPRVGEARLQPHHLPRRRRQRQRLPRPDYGVARPRRALAPPGGEQGRGQGPRRAVPEQGLQAVGQGAPPAPLGAHGDVGVPRLLPSRGARRRPRPPARQPQPRHRHRRAARRRRGAGGQVRAQGEPGPDAVRVLHGGHLRPRHRPVHPRRRLPRRRLRPPLRLRRLLRVQVVLRSGEAPPRPVGVGQRVRHRPRRPQEGLGRHPGDPEEAVAVAGREAAHPVAGGGGQGAARQARERQRQGRQERPVLRGRRLQVRAVRRGGGVRDQGPEQGGAVRPGVAPGPAGALQEARRARDGRGGAVRAVGAGRRRPHGEDGRLLQGVQDHRQQARRAHVQRPHQLDVRVAGLPADLRRLRQRRHRPDQDHRPQDTDRPLRGGELRRRRQDVHPDEGVPEEGGGRRRAPLRLQPRRGGRQGREAGRLGDEDPEDERAGAVARGR